MYGFFRRSPFVCLGNVVFTRIGLGHLPQPDQVLMRGWLALRLFRLVRLKIEPKLEVVSEEFFGRFLVGIQEDGLMGTAMQSPLIRFDRAGRILLLK